jgi:hypothetical protein
MPVALLDAVELSVSVRVFVPVAIVIVEPGDGPPAPAVPTALGAVALVFRERVFALYATVIAALAAVGALLNVPVWVPGNAWLAVKTWVPTVTVWPLAGLAVKVPVSVATSAFASKVTPSMVRVEAVVMFALVRVAMVRVKESAVPPTFMLQSRVSGVLLTSAAAPGPKLLGPPSTPRGPVQRSGVTPLCAP